MLRLPAFVLAIFATAAGCDGGSAPADRASAGSGAGADASSGRAGVGAAPGGAAPTSAGSGSVSSQGGAAGNGGTAAGGTSSSGGSATLGGAGAEPEIDPTFKLLWRDDFNVFDATRWAKATHTFEENLARFTGDNVVVEGGVLELRVTNVPNGDRPYSAAEVYSLAEFKYGRFEGRIKFCAGSGIVSSLFTYKDDVEQSWQEIDVEHLGYLPNSIQYNLISGTLQQRQYQPKVIALPYAPAAEFHDYAIEWKPDGVTFYVDGAQTHRDVQATLQDPAKLRMNAWPANNAVTSFAGPLDPSAIPCQAQYDWVSAYSYTP